MATAIKVTKKTSSKRAPDRPIRNKKFMQTLSIETFNVLDAISRSRGVSLQELLRAQVIPDWLKSHGDEIR